MNDAQQQFAQAFKGVHAAMRRLRGRQTHHHNGLSYAQSALLFALEQCGAMSARSLGEAASLSPGSVTQMLDGLEACGMVARTRSEEDKRVVLTELTERGREATAELRARNEAGFRAAIGRFSDDDLRVAGAVLESLTAHFTRLADEAEPAPLDAVGVGRDDAA